LTGSKLALLDTYYGEVEKRDAKGNEQDEVSEGDESADNDTSAECLVGSAKKSGRTDSDRRANGEGEEAEEGIALSDGEAVPAPTEPAEPESRYAFVIGIGCALLLG
jgi:hypothetical protein